MQKFLQQLVPFLFIGIAIVLFASGIILIAYLFFFGALLGLVLFGISWVRNRFFASKMPARKIRKGRIIDSDDWKKM